MDTSVRAARDATPLGDRVEISGSPAHRRLPVLTDGAVDHGAVIMVERERIVDVRERQVRPGLEHLFRRHARAVDARDNRTDGEARSDDHRLATATPGRHSTYG